MTLIRQQLEAREREILAPQAARSADTKGRLRPEPEDDIRPAFQRDRDRVIHSKAFRRLKHKTQVFFSPTGDHYRTRLTHTLEVSQIARTIAKVLHLHEELTEAIALGHDLGHTPFGHAGERVLDELAPGGFNHYEQSLRVVDVLENDRRGLNLTWEVRDGIAKHSKGKRGAPVGVDPSNRASTIEGQIARVADLVAYVNHDIDDAVRAGVLKEADLPAAAVEVLGHSSSERIGRMVGDVVHATLDIGLTEIQMTPPVLEATLILREFLFGAVYENEISTGEFKKARGILGGLWEKVGERADEYLDPRTLAAEGKDAALRDFIAGMTDRYAVALFEQLFIPRPWVGADGP
jgi:dGTPase